MSKLKLVDDWKDFWKWYSTHSAVLATSLLAAWAAIPEELQSTFSTTDLKLMAIGLIVLGFGGRLVDQPVKNSAKSADATNDAK